MVGLGIDVRVDTILYSYISPLRLFVMSPPLLIFFLSSGFIQVLKFYQNYVWFANAKFM